MKQLTDERIKEIWVEHGLDECDPEGFARAIEAEVLRINGLNHSTDAGKMTEPSVDELRRQMREVMESAYRNPGKAVSMPDLVASEGRKFMRGEPSLFDQLPFGEMQQIGQTLVFVPAAPRATGCPDTMDDTARFVAEELPAILREQAS